jgi:hypothetical protein
MNGGFSSSYRVVKWFAGAILDEITLVCTM